MVQTRFSRPFVCCHWSKALVTHKRVILVRKNWFKCCIPYYRNSDATFNLMELCITLSGDVHDHPLPGPESNSTKTPVCIGNRVRNNNKNRVARGHVKSNCIKIQLRMAPSQKFRNHSKQLEIAHLNAESLKCRHHFNEIKEVALQKSFDILTFSETWFNSTTTNASVEIEGYSIFRLDRLRKSGAGVCAYVKHGLKAMILKDLTGIGESGLHQLWLQVQNKKLRSLLVCVVYRPPEVDVACLQKALSLNKEIVVTGDANCDLLAKNPKGDALFSFCTSVNTTQLIDTPTRVTKSSRSLLVIVF